MFKNIIIMTKSDKHGGFCVAGIDTERNKFIRLMSEDKSTFGALSEDDMLYNDSSKVKILDIAKIKILKLTPTSIQPENVTIDTTFRWEKIGEITKKELEQYLDKSVQDVFSNVNNYLIKKEAEKNNSSLLFIQVKNAKIYQGFKNKTKIAFTFKGNKYMDFSVTDPDYYGKEKTFPVLNIVFSLPDDNWSKGHNEYYKFAAKIFEV